MVKPIMRDVLFLGQKSIPATEEDLQMGRDLQDTLAANREACVGMAANMIGVKKRIIIVNAGFRDIIMFNPLGYTQMKAIMRLQIEDLNVRLREQSIGLEADDSALEKIMTDAYDPLYGARPLKRYIEKEIVTELSKKLIAGTLIPGNKYRLSAKNGVFEYTKCGAFQN